MNKYYEIKVSVYLENNIYSKDMYDKQANLINYSFNSSQILSCLHKRKGFKHYSFSGLYPVEKDYIYKADEIYNFLFRTYKKDIADEFIRVIQKTKNDDFVVTDVSLRIWQHKEINYVDNITPTVITLKDGIRWNKDTHGIEIAKESVFKNLVKKYNSLNNTNFKFRYDDIIKDIEVKSKCAIVVNYKNIQVLGYKLRISYKDNSIAQEIANLSVVEGIGEKNSSFGMGFVKPYFKGRLECAK